MHESELNTNIENTNYSDIQNRIAGLSKNEHSRFSENESRIAPDNNEIKNADEIAIINNMQNISKPSDYSGKSKSYRDENSEKNEQIFR